MPYKPWPHQALHCGRSKLTSPSTDSSWNYNCPASRWSQQAAGRVRHFVAAFAAGWRSRGQTTHHHAAVLMGVLTELRPLSQRDLSTWAFTTRGWVCLSVCRLRGSCVIIFVSCVVICCGSSHRVQSVTDTPTPVLTSMCVGVCVCVCARVWLCMCMHDCSHVHAMCSWANMYTKYAANAIIIYTFWSLETFL